MKQGPDDPEPCFIKKFRLSERKDYFEESLPFTILSASSQSSIE